MKKILLIVSLVMGIFVSIQAADEIFIQVNNTSWACKTRLECCVDYNNIKKNFSLILEGTTDTDPITKTLYTLPKGAI